jgi:hypothetical protein
MGSSSSKQSNTLPQGQTITQTGLPEWYSPYIKDVLDRGMEASYEPYVPYKDERIAGFTPEQLDVHKQIMGLQQPGQFKTATDLATAAGQKGLNAFYQPYDASPFRELTSRPITAPQITAARADFAPDLKAFEMDSPERVAAERATTGSFIQPGTASQYMSPYMQNVVDVQKQAAIEDARKAQLGANLGAARQGTYGGARQLLAQTEREKALGQQLGQIQATGSQAAYDAAQRQFEAEQARQLEASRTNIGVGLEAALANQKAMQDKAARDLESRLRTRELETDVGLKTSLANLDYENKARVENAAAELKASGMNQDDAYRTALANLEKDIENRRLAEQSRQFGADYGLRGAGVGLDASRALGSLGETDLASLIKILGAKGAVGEEIRGLDQDKLNLAYQDFLRQREYPMSRLKDYVGLIGGLPSAGEVTMTNTYSRPGSLSGQLLGLGGNLASAYMMSQARSARGGEIKSYNSGGMVAFAVGGNADSDSVFKLRDDPKELLYSTLGDPAKLQNAIQQGADPTAVGIAAMLGKKIHDSQAMAMAPKQTTIAGLLNPQQPQQAGLAAIGPQAGQAPMGNPMQAQPMSQPMMAGGGLLDIPLPYNYYNDASYSHGGIARFPDGGEALLEQFRERPANRRQKAYQVFGLDKIGDAFSRAASKLEERERLISGLQEYARKNFPQQDPMDIPEIKKAGILTMPELRELYENFTGAKVLPDVEEFKVTSEKRNIEPAAQKFFKERIELGSPGFGSDAAKNVIPSYAFKPKSDVSSTGKDSTSESGVSSPTLMEQYIAAARQKLPAAAPTAPMPEFDFDKSYSDRAAALQKQYGSSTVKDEYLKALSQQEEPKDTRNLDFWRTIGDVSRALVDKSSESGATFIGSLAGASSALPESVAASMRDKQAREDKAKADRLANLAAMYNIDANDRAAMVDLSKTAFDMTDTEAQRFYDRQKEKYQRAKDAEEGRRKEFEADKELELKLLELQMGEDQKPFTNVERQYYQDLIDQGYTPDEAAAKVAKELKGNSLNTTPTNADIMRATEAAQQTVRNMFINSGNATDEDILLQSPKAKEAIQKEIERILSLSGKIPVVADDIFEEADSFLGE